MRFIARSIWGGLIVVACAAVLWFGASSYSKAKQTADESRSSRPVPERIYPVRDVTLVAITATPTMQVYGEVQAGRILELRATAAGRIVDISPDLREGVSTNTGEMLVRVDPTDLRAREADTLTVLADARSRQAEAEQSLALARADLEAAIAQLKLRRNALARQQDLVQRGIAAATSVEAPQLSASSAEQSVVSRRSAYVAAKQRMTQTATDIQRAQIEVQGARRDSADTAITAPFGGILTDVTATLGSLVSPNERLARLIDMRSLEAAFRVSDALYARLLTEQGALAPLTATVLLKLGERVVETRATLDRPAAMVGEEGGRTVYAKLDAPSGTPLRPGDFVRISITESPIEQVAEIPARAASEAGDIFIIGDDNRLIEHRATILRRLPETLIVSAVPFGKKIVAERRPQLGAGIMVQSPEQAALKEAEEKKKRAARRAARFGGGGGKPTGEKGGKPPADGKRRSGKRGDGNRRGQRKRPKAAGE